VAGPVVRRSEWSYVHATFTPLRLPTSEAVQHHTAGANPGNDLAGYLRGLEAGEMARGDGLIALAYHRLIVNDGPHKGTRVEVRPWGMQGGATLHHNETSHAVVITGNFETDHPTPEALDSAAEEWASGIRDGFVSPAAVIQPHNVYFSTACPGRNLIAALPDLRTRVAEKLHPLPKVPPMFNPPKTMPPTVAMLDRPGGGVWHLHDDGHVTFVGRGEWLPRGMVGPNDRAAWGNRHAARIDVDPHNPDGFQITATTGETYVPSGH
jgi:hypothetical protein